MRNVNVTVEFDWVEMGPLTLDQSNRLFFPKLQPRPGIYRFFIQHSDGAAAYIGETELLDRRMQHYRTPGKRQETNIRLNGVLKVALAHGGHVSLSIVTDKIIVRSDGSPHQIDLSRKIDRQLLENAAILKAYASGLAIMNA